MSTYQLRTALRALAERHAVPATLPLSRLALLDPVRCPATVVGVASAPVPDLHRTLIAPNSIELRPDVPLRLDHGSTDVGRVSALEYDARGNLICRAVCDDERAARSPAFSVAIDVEEFEIIDADGPDFHALVTKARLREVSLVQMPVCPAALVKSRQHAPHLAFHSLMIRRVRALQKVVGSIQQELRA